MSRGDVAIDLEDVQGLVFAGWGKARSHAAFLLARLGEPEAARRWLAIVNRQVTSARRDVAAAAGTLRVQVALTPSGLTALGVPAEVVAGLPQEAKVGMAARARLLGDHGDSAPERWTVCPPGQRVDALVMLYEVGERERAAAVAEHTAIVREHGGSVVGVELSAPWRQQEPFGFADGLSQPFVAGQPGEPRPGQDTIATGEILLGYDNEYGQLPQAPRWDGVDIGKNGSYLVFRKLEQDVGLFWRYFGDRARELAGQSPVPRGVGDATEWLAARAMGRWLDGSPLVEAPDAPDPYWAHPDRVNAFGFLDKDAHGLRCPIGSHVRRANPRDARGGGRAESIKVVNRHRILRRGRGYGDAVDLDRARRGELDGGPRGLLFLSLQASITHGFEFIQQTWLANAGFAGVRSEVDPIVGGNRGIPECAFTIPADPVRIRIAGLPSFVTTRGGGYFFLPSRSTLARLADE